MTSAPPSTAQEFDAACAGEQMRRSRHPLRRFVKGFYLRNRLRDLTGPTIDHGCSAGQLLRRLPPGSAGVEVNPRLNSALRGEGLTVHGAGAEMADFELQGLARGHFKSLVIAHVLEHLSGPVAALRLLLVAGHRLGLERLVVDVPGVRGYASDRTHKTCIDRAFIERQVPRELKGYRRSEVSYFPLPWECVGRWFVFLEMKVVFHRIPRTG